MKAYWYDNKEGDQRLPHNSSTPIPSSKLASLGVLYSHHPTESTVNSLATNRSYAHRDTITVSPSAMGEVYESKVKMFFNEHLHEDEEIRWIREGAGYFDVRSEGDEWVRIRLEEGDLIILPAGIYHRFTTDENNYIKAVRLFKDEPKWTPLNRGDDTDTNPHRRQYLETRDGSPN